MFKKWSLLFILVFFGFEAGAREFSLRYEDYVHLSNTEKDKIVVKLMEFAVELESKYDYEVKKYGEHSPQVQKLKETLLKLNQFFISSAYANPPKPGWDKYAKDFKELFLGNKEADCIFAGWPSKTYPFQGRSICSHPSKSSSKQVNSRYPKPDAGSNCAKAGTNKIQCNPTLFGFQDMQKKTLFCVDSSNGAQNSAYHCMKLALSDSDKDKESRLKMLRENLDKSPEIFEALQKYVYELCVCKATPDGFNKSYHEKIRPHRTCYGMMNMLGAVTCEMDNVSPLKNTSIFQDLSNKISMSAKQDEIDSLYIKFLNEVPGSAPEEYNRLCPNDPAITISGGDKDKSKDKDPPGTTTSGTTSGVTSGAQGGTPGGNDPSESELTCSKAICSLSKETSTYECEFDVTNKAGEKLLGDKPEYTPPKDATVATLDVKMSIEGKEHSFSCPTDFEGEIDTSNDDPKPSLTLSIKTKGAKSYDVKAETKDDKGWELVWTLVLPKTIPEKDVKKGWDDPAAKKDDKTEKTPSKIAGLSEAGEEEETPPAKDDKKDPAVTDKDKKDPTPSNEEKKDPATDEGKKDPAADPGKKTDPATPSGDETPKGISQERKSEDYEVCAQLKKAGQKSVPETPTCVKIDKLSTALPPTQGGMMPQQQAPMRRASDTSALGIK